MVIPLDVRPLAPHKSDIGDTGMQDPIRLMTLDPGHFHAALVQKRMYEQISPVIDIFAPQGPDLDLHMQRVEAFNRRAGQPTSWKHRVHAGPHYLDAMLQQRPGNVVVAAGNSSRRPEYLRRSVEAGLHVLADKPVCIDPAGWQVLEAACQEAQRKGLLVSDIMTQRHEITSIIARELVNTPDVFGALQQGTPEAPAVEKKSVHHLYKHVSGQALIRPAWYFDVTQQGEGIVDVTTHLIDNTLWECFPDEAIHHAEVSVLLARRWPTVVDRAQFSQVTGLPDFPAFLHAALDAQGALPYYCNGEFTCAIRGVHARMWVAWDFTAPPGGDDTHVSITRGTRSEVSIRQGQEQGYRPEVYVEPSAGVTAADLGASLGEGVGGPAIRIPGSHDVCHGGGLASTHPRRVPDRSRGPFRKSHGRLSGMPRSRQTAGVGNSEPADQIPHDDHCAGEITITARLTPPGCGHSHTRVHCAGALDVDRFMRPQSATAPGAS